MKISPFKPGFVVLPIVASLFPLAGVHGQDLSRPMVYSVPGMDQVDVRADVVYKREGRTK